MHHHIFGQHAKCEQCFCLGPKQCETNLVPEVIKCGLIHQIDHILRRVVDNAKSLLFNIDNNYCEQFHSINTINNKYIAGIRFIFSQKQSYNTRVQAAVVSFYSGGE